MNNTFVLLLFFSPFVEWLTELTPQTDLSLLNHVCTESPPTGRVDDCGNSPQNQHLRDSSRSLPHLLIVKMRKAKFAWKFEWPDTSASCNSGESPVDWITWTRSYRVRQVPLGTIAYRRTPLVTTGYQWAPRGTTLPQCRRVTVG